MFADKGKAKVRFKEKQRKLLGNASADLAFREERKWQYYQFRA